MDDLTDQPIDLRLVVCDMDGTLLDGDKRLPEGLPALLVRLRERGVAFCPASGRQHATLVRMFPDLPPPAVLIAENGAVVTAGGEAVSTTPLAAPTVRAVVTAAHDLALRHDLGVVVCTPRTSYVQRTDEAFRSEVDPYYAEVTEVADLEDLDEATVAEVVKVALHVVEGPEGEVEQTLREAAAGQQVVVSGAHWVDVMAADVDKGVAVAALRDRLGIGHHQVAVFGDQLNDAAMMPEGRWSFAVANAVPGIKERAAYEAPANTEDGVLRTLHRLLDGEHPDAPDW